MKLETFTKPKLSVYKPPHCHTGNVGGSYSIFLAGSIEMGKAEDWQTKVQTALLDKSVLVFNPRRDDWDNSWKQTIEDKNFAGQVKWEHDHLRLANMIFFYFDPSTKSPISLMELGLVCAEKEVIVVCPDGFWRKGNVEFICNEYDIPLFNTLDDGIKELLKYLN